jgi:hypothetical protein
MNTNIKNTELYSNMVPYQCVSINQPVFVIKMLFSVKQEKILKYYFDKILCYKWEHTSTKYVNVSMLINPLKAEFLLNNI